MRKSRRGQRGGAMLETLLMWMLAITATMIVGTHMQQAQGRLMRAAFDPVIEVLR